MTALLRYPGAKWSLSKKLIDYFPKHKSYLELFFGSGAILFNKNRVSLETVYDIDNEVVNFFDVLRKDFRTIQNELKYIPYSKEVYNKIYNSCPENKIIGLLNFLLSAGFLMVVINLIKLVGVIVKVQLDQIGLYYSKI